MTGPPTLDDLLATVDDEDLRALHLVSHQLRATLEQIEDADWQRSTPCPDWDLRALVDHVVGGNWFTCGVLDGASADDALAETMAAFGNGAVDVSHASASCVDQLAAFGRANVFDRSWPHVAGPLPGRAMLRLRLHDLIVHLWDLQTSLGIVDSLPAELIAWGQAELADEGSRAATHFGTAHVGYEATVASGAPAAGLEPTARYLSTFGRDVVPTRNS